MSIGYACIAVGVPNTCQKSCRMKNVTKEKLFELIDFNLNSLENIIEYNIENNIKLFRISSDLIPFGSSYANDLPWWDIFSAKFLKIGQRISNSGMRVSMHPGQYTVLNSPNDEVVAKAIDDLNYHNLVLNCLGVDSQNKIVLHIGGIYNDKENAIERFITNYHKLNNAVKSRLILENDDRSYNINDVLKIGKNLKAPVVFDNLHNAINPFDKQKSDLFWINECKATWCEKDGNQKVHYSQQNQLKKLGSHSMSIRINEFMDYYESLARNDLDIMLEVKDKNLSAVKCINCTSVGNTIKTLEIEWSKYKYLILESSPSDYLEIRKLLKNKKSYPAVCFYNFIESALGKENNIGNSLNAALHIWGYFKDKAPEKERKIFLKKIQEYKQGKIPIKTIKNSLFKMAIKYNQAYILESYYFIVI